MIIKKVKNTLLGSFYSLLFKGPCTGLKVTGLIILGNPKNVQLGKNVLLKRNCELLAGKREKSILIGNKSEIHEYTTLRSFKGYIHIGDSTSINRSGNIWGEGTVKIGNNVRIGPNVNIISNNHVFQTRKKLIMEQGSRSLPIEIKDNVWIGANVTILPGVTIAEGTVIGAGSVVTKNTTPYSVYWGFPAKKIRNWGD